MKRFAMAATKFHAEFLLDTPKQHGAPRLLDTSAMTDGRPSPMKHRKDIVKDRKEIGVVEFPIEKFMKFRDATDSCVHIEAAWCCPN